MRYSFLAIGLACCTLMQAEEPIEISTEAFISENHAQLPLKGSETQNNETLAAYVQGALDATFPNQGVTVTVKNGVLFLSHLPKDKTEASKIVSFARNSVSKPIERSTQKKHTTDGLWFPESTVLFPTQVANPRQIAYSCALRSSDKVTGHWSGPVSFADRFPMYRWTNIWKGDLQLELEAGVFSVFNLSKANYPLINTDYYVGIPLTYKQDDWRGKVRLYHVSSHLGDEYMNSRHHKHAHRKNKSYEALDVSCAYYVLPEWYFFGTLGSVLAADNEYRMGRAYVEYGFEVRGEKKIFDQLFRQPFLSVFLRNAQENNFHEDMTIATGYEWGKITNIGRLVRLFLEYHQGYSQEGQFTKKKSNYLELKLSYGF